MTEFGMVFDDNWFRHKPKPEDQDRELLENILHSLYTLDRKVEWLMTESNATQADIDALTQTVTDDDAKVQAAVAALQAEIASLEGQGVDVSGLQAAVAQLSSDADADTPAPVTPPSA